MTITVFCDTETTGLYPALGAEVWEVAMIRRDGDSTPDRYVWQLPVDLGKADPIALRIGRFHERRWPAAPPGYGFTDWGRYASRHVAHGGQVEWEPDVMAVVKEEDMPRWASAFAALAHGATWVGAVPDFDATRFLDPLLRKWGACPSWGYHLIDVETLAAGALMKFTSDLRDGRANLMVDDGEIDRQRAIARPPWNSEDLSRTVGVDPGQFDRHTALGDCEWSLAIYDAVMGVPSVAVPYADPRSDTCIEAWPECHPDGYDPRCCRFPKPCSPTG